MSGMGFGGFEKKVEMDDAKEMTKTIEQKAREALVETAREVACQKVGECFTQGTDVLVVARAVKAAKYSYLAAAKEAKQEIAALRARVTELEGMVPKWVDLFAPDYDCIARAGWVSIPPSGKTGRLRLMVPPIPLPEGEND